MKQRTIYSLMATGGAIGMAAAFLQTTEKMTLLAHKDAILACDLNSVFSCTNVLNAWQSSVFGFPNSIMCLTLFTIFTTTALIGFGGGNLPRGVRISVHALTLFTLCFALWFLAQSIYVIGSLCILCIFCFAGLLLINWGWLRLNAADLPIGERARTILAHAITKNYDVLGWCILATLVAMAMLIRFYL